VSYPSVMSFEDQSASGSQEICDLFAEFIERTYVDDSWVLSSPGPDLVNDEPSFGLLQFTVSEVENALLELDSSKSPGTDGVPPHLHCPFSCSSTGHLQRVSSTIHENSGLLLPCTSVVGAMTYRITMVLRLKSCCSNFYCTGSWYRLL
jgi:hypothetical protein